MGSFYSLLSLNANILQSMPRHQWTLCGSILLLRRSDTLAGLLRTISRLQWVSRTTLCQRLLSHVKLQTTPPR